MSVKLSALKNSAHSLSLHRARKVWSISPNWIRSVSIAWKMSYSLGDVIKVKCLEKDKMGHIESFSKKTLSNNKGVFP